MLKLAKLTIALAAASLAIPAMADWPKGPSQRVNAPSASVSTPAVAAKSADGFVYSGAEESGYQLSQYRYFQNEEKEIHEQWTEPAGSARATAPTVAKGPVGGFVYRGEGTGWEVAEHSFVFVDGRLAHSEECDHAVRIVKGPTPTEVDASRAISPGA